MSDKVFVDSTNISNIMGQLGPLITTRKWLLAPPPANTMRGVDFYNATDFVSALVLSVQLFKNTHGYLPRLESPSSFNEHIFARKFFAPLPLPSLADKLGVRDYVRERLGESALIPVVWSGERVDDLFTANLPAGRFVLKANHGFDMNLFLDLPQDLATRRDEIRSKAQGWLGTRFGYNWGEWQYSVIKPRLFLETFLGRDDKESMADFKVHCFHGKPRLIQVVTGRFTHKRHGQYTPDWTYLAGVPGNESVEFARPKNLDVLIESAERLARGLEYARIDLYTDFEQVVKFGEITLTPGDGRQPFADLEFDRWLGGFFAPPDGG
jgi:hypothetical protein